MAFKIKIVSGSLAKQASKLRKRAPLLYDTIVKTFLVASASDIVNSAMTLAGKEARNEGHYMNSFRRTSVMGAMGNRWIKAYNLKPYSLVIEHGGKWTKMPPPGVLDEWISKNLGITDPKEIKAAAFAIGMALTGKGKSKLARVARSGQPHFKGKKGGLKIMNRSVMKNVGRMKVRVRSLISQANKFLSLRSKALKGPKL